MAWSSADVPDQSGRTAVVTGASSGLGLEVTETLAGHGARVVMAARPGDRLERAREAIAGRVPGAELETVGIDLGSLESIRAGAAAISTRDESIDLLFDNAGVMATPHAMTADGFESQFGINHLGHFALTGLLMSALCATPASRVIVVTSAMRRLGAIHFDDPNWVRSYRRWSAYAQSKLANLLFAVELERRLRSAGAESIAVAAHPGYAATNLQQGGTVLQSRVYGIGSALLAQPAFMGAWPLLYAGTAADVVGGRLYGPGGLAHMRGAPREEAIEAKARDAEVARRLWDYSVEATGVDYGILETASS